MCVLCSLALAKRPQYTYLSHFVLSQTRVLNQSRVLKPEGRDRYEYFVMFLRSHAVGHPDGIRLAKSGLFLASSECFFLDIFF